ncbi:beta-propeller fold lactonase family protein [Brucella pituitosa]|uniref:beta-propeller fold lactonase family protein n=1 Tax=Brucella pituitosa TaxID=571256 RepID=UPI0009A18859|nr:beta-propeller fold lactonase family protein [Brucella pituitosa]
MSWFAYTADNMSNSIQAYSIRPDGSLDHLGSAIPDGAYCMHSYANKLFVAGGGPDGGVISVYHINKDGSLSERIKNYSIGGINTIEFIVSVRRLSSEFLILFPYGRGIQTYKYNENTNTIEKLGEYSSENEEFGNIALDGAGRFLYGVQTNGRIEFDIWSFFVSPSGTLEMWDKTKLLDHDDFPLAVDPMGHFIYAGSVLSTDLRGCKVDFGKLSPIGGDVRDYVPGPPSAIKIRADGKILFASTTVAPITGEGENRILSYSIHPETGMLTALSDHKCETMVSSLVTAMGDKYLYAPSYTKDQIDWFEIDANGKLLQKPTTATKIRATAMVVVEV